MTGAEAAAWARAFIRELLGLIEPAPRSTLTVTLRVGQVRPRARKD